jgi:hypothetical protein
MRIEKHTRFSMLLLLSQNPKTQKVKKHEKQILHIQILLCFWQLFCEFWLQQGCRARPVLRVATHRIGMAIRLTAVNSCLSPCLGACPTGKAAGEVPPGPKRLLEQENVVAGSEGRS